MNLIVLKKAYNWYVINSNNSMWYLYVFVGGGIGALGRFGVQQLIGKADGTHFPMSTFLVNLLGCFLIGCIASIGLKFKWNEMMMLFLTTGILGGFTTFSSLVFEFTSLIKNQQIGTAFLYLGMSNILGIMACYIGFLILK